MQYLGKKEGPSKEGSKDGPRRPRDAAKQTRDGQEMGQEVKRWAKSVKRWEEGGSDALYMQPRDRVHGPPSVWGEAALVQLLVLSLLVLLLRPHATRVWTRGGTVASRKCRRRKGPGVEGGREATLRKKKLHPNRLRKGHPSSRLEAVDLLRMTFDYPGMAAPCRLTV
jgi:hypothetical protein